MYDVVLVGERHIGAVAIPIGYGPYYDQLQRELELILDNKPDYLFLECDEDYFQKYKDEIYPLSFLNKAAKMVGAKVVPMGEAAMENIPVEFEEKRVHVRDKLERLKEPKPRILSSISKDDEREKLEKMSEGYSLASELSPDIYYGQRERKWAHMIAKILKNNPNAKSMVIVGKYHVESERTEFPKLLKEYGLGYRTEIVSRETDEIDESKKDNKSGN